MVRQRCLGTLAFLAAMVSLGRADIDRVDTGQVISGTEGIAPAHEVLTIVDGGGRNVPPLMPIPIVIRCEVDVAGGELELVFDQDGWHSLISFGSGIPVQLGGTFDLRFADDVGVATQVGPTPHIFEWTGVSPFGELFLTSPYAWDVAGLYTTGELTFAVVPGPVPCSLGLLSCLLFTWCRRLSQSTRETIVFLAIASGFFATDALASEFRLSDATIGEINKSFDAGTLSSEALVQLYLDRIDAYDNSGPMLNSMISVNAQALEVARELDNERRTSGPRSPLHGIPVVLKDNLDTKDLPTSAGNMGLRDSQPLDDAFLVRRLREAGAIVLGKANMDEFGFGVIGRSSLGGQTLNPYDLAKVPFGSSGGTAVALTANLATIGFGADAIGSVRMPASAMSLVGLKPTLGLISRDGVMAYDVLRETAGPMTRTVTDLAIVLDVVAGVDAADAWTAESLGNIPDTYVTSLRSDALANARFGRLPFAAGRTMRDVADAAYQKLSDMGANLQGSVNLSFVPRTFDSLYDGFEHDMNRYLESLGPDRRFTDLDSLVASGEYLPLLDSFFGSLTKGDVSPQADPEYARMIALRETMRQRVLTLMDEAGLDAIVYPTLPVVPTLINTNDRVWLPVQYFDMMNIASFLGFPAVTVPAGLTADGLPLGLEFMGRPYSEPSLIGYAYAYEQATNHRRPPESTPPLPGDGRRGDFDWNGVVNVNDVDLLASAMRTDQDAWFDLSADGKTGPDDLRIWVVEVKHTWFGDANLDGEFNTADLVEVFQAGGYEDGVEDNSGWATGDWDADGDFSTGDLILAFQDGGYEQGPRVGVAAVPEPSGVMLLLLGLIGLLGTWRVQ